jgi:hypothetical protein
MKRAFVCSARPMNFRKVRIAGKVSLIGLVVFASLASSALTVGFKPVQTYPVGTNPRFVAIGDFNHDGKPDLAVLNTGDATISILLGNGDGSFQPATTVGGDTNSYVIVSADLNGDQRADLVITGDSGVTVLLSHGDGTFEPPQHLDGGVSPGQVVVDDFNSDGKPDLAVTNTNGVGILLGNGDGTFQSRVDYGIGTGSSGGTAVAGDFNGDHREDLAVGNGAGIWILLGNGNGTFQTPVTAAGFSHVRSAADFDGDGKLDLLFDDGVSVCGTWPHLYVCGGPVGMMLGNGDGTFKSPSILKANSITFSAFAADFDGDGNVDIAVVDGSSVNVYAGDGKGGFASAVPFPIRAAGTNGLVVGAIAADLTGNKAPDIAGTDAGDADVGVLLNNTGSDFSISASTVAPGTLSQGQSATSTLSLTLLNKFEFPVSLACSVQPVEAGSPGCSFDSTSVTFDSSGKASAQLTITAGTATAFVGLPRVGSRTRPEYYLWLPLAGFAVAGCGFASTPSRRKKRPAFLAGGIVLAGLMLLVACGGGGSGNTHSSATSYTVTITGTSASVQHSTSLTVSVQ